MGGRDSASSRVKFSERRSYKGDLDNHYRENKALIGTSFISYYINLKYKLYFPKVEGNQRFRQTYSKGFKKIQISKNLMNEIKT